MAVKKYHLVGVKHCKNKMACVLEVARTTHTPLHEALESFDKKEILADPSDPNYRHMIEVLEENNVEVFDYSQIQLPPREESKNEQPCYT